MHAGARRALACSQRMTSSVWKPGVVLESEKRLGRFGVPMTTTMLTCVDLLCAVVWHIFRGTKPTGKRPCSAAGAAWFTDGVVFTNDVPTN